MKRNRIISAVLVCVLALLLAGCGQSVESKSAYVQHHAEEIAVNDVVQLLNLEGLKVDRMEPSVDFAEQFPGVQICKINGDNVLLMKVVEGDATAALQELGWEDLQTIDMENPEAVVAQLMTDYAADEATYQTGTAYAAKNIAACYIAADDDTAAETVARVFDQHINGN